MPGPDPTLANTGGRAARGPAAGLPPLAVLLAPLCLEGAQSENAEYMADAPPEPGLQQQAAAVFPQDEGSAVTVSFVAETAFDCEDADGWPFCED